MSHDHEYKVGIIGYGLATTIYHIPLLSHCPGLRLHSVVQRAAPPTAQIVEQRQQSHVTIDYPTLKHYQHATHLLADPEVDIVVVATPTYIHYNLVKEALENNKHVVVEKPFCPSSAECDELIALAKVKQRILTVFHNRRLDSDFVTFSELSSNPATSPHLHPLIEFVSHFDRYIPDPATGWKTSLEPGSGVLYDLGADLIDQVLLLFGLPTWVSAFLPNQRTSDPLDIEDSFTVLLYYEATKGKNDGKPMQIELKSSMISVSDSQLRFRARGWKGSWTKYHIDAQEEQLKEHGVRAPLLPGYGLELPSNFGTLVTVEPVSGQHKDLVFSSNEVDTSSGLSVGATTAASSSSVLLMSDVVAPNPTAGPIEKSPDITESDVEMTSAPFASSTIEKESRTNLDPNKSSSSSPEDGRDIYPYKHQKLSLGEKLYAESSEASRLSGSSSSNDLGLSPTRHRKTGYYIMRTPAAKGDYVTFYRNIFFVLSLVTQRGMDVEFASKDLLVHPTQAREVIRIIELAKLSHQTGRRIEVTQESMK